VIGRYHTLNQGSTKNLLTLGSIALNIATWCIRLKSRNVTIFYKLVIRIATLIINFHPEIQDSRIELSAFSNQRSA
jgi:hypothetical protein